MKICETCNKVLDLNEGISLSGNGETYYLCDEHSGVKPVEEEMTEPEDWDAIDPEQGGLCGTDEEED